MAWHGRRRLELGRTAAHFHGIRASLLAHIKEDKVFIPNSATDFVADLKEQYGLDAIPLTDDIMIRAAQLPDVHKDPADRIIIATSLAHDLTIVTGDSKFPQYGVRTIC